MYTYVLVVEWNRIQQAISIHNLSTHPETANLSVAENEPGVCTRCEYTP